MSWFLYFWKDLFGKFNAGRSIIEFGQVMPDTDDDASIFPMPALKEKIEGQICKRRGFGNFLASNSCSSM